ncbi:hypothetical protein GS466_23675 [Rhodococcus hoagii]|nr:hypothetical protein [Prescottella equi]
MSAPTFDRELIDAASDLRYGNPAGWQQFLAEHPELAAEAEKSKVTKDSKGTGNSKGLAPYRCWEHLDRGRWERKNVDTWPEGLDPSACAVSQKAATNQNQLEVCRSCGNPLEVPTDPDGVVHRNAGAQPEYCSERCRKDVKNARDRARRAEESPRRKPPRRLPDLSTITVAGIGDMSIAPAEWNRLQPRRDPEMFKPVPAPGERLPYLHHNARSRRITSLEAREASVEPARPYSPEREGYPLPIHQSIIDLRRRPARRNPLSSAGRIARRYGTGGTPRPPALTPGWDRVASRWKFFPRSRCSEYVLIRGERTTWRVSHCISA